MIDSASQLIFSFGILRVIINRKWCHVSTQPLLCCSKLMHNKQSSGRLNIMPPRVLMHHSCGMLNLCSFWKGGCILWNSSFFNLLLVLSWALNWLPFLISVPVSDVMNFTWKACSNLFFSREMAGCLIADEEIGKIGVLWRAGWCLKPNLLWRAFWKAFESSRNG